jgi:hypothetical protein
MRVFLFFLLSSRGQSKYSSKCSKYSSAFLIQLAIGTWALAAIGQPLDVTARRHVVTMGTFAVAAGCYATLPTVAQRLACDTHPNGLNSKMRTMAKLHCVFWPKSALCCALYCVVIRRRRSDGSPCHVVVASSLFSPCCLDARTLLQSCHAAPSDACPRSSFCTFFAKRAATFLHHNVWRRRRYLHSGDQLLCHRF